MKFLRKKAGGLELAVMDATDHSFPKHSHDEFYIGANIIGRERIWLDGKEYEASIDDVTLYNPGSVQSADAGGQPWRYASLYVDAATFWDLTDSHNQTFLETPILTNPMLAARIRELISFGLSPAGAGEEEIREQTALLLQCILSTSGQSGAASREQRAANRAQAKRVAEHLLDTMAAPPSLAELARQEGTTQLRLLRAFQQQFGLPPFAWLNVEKLKRARHLIDRGHSLAAIAHELGFSDQAHFTRRFRDMYGVPPGLWKAAAAETCGGAAGG
jgi:AraC-like DNA-binding protein